MRWLIHGLVAALLMAGLSLGTHVEADDPPIRAADVTEPGRSMDRALRLTFSAPHGETQEERTLVFLIDATASLQSSGFITAVEGALAGLSRDQLAALSLGVWKVGERDWSVEPTDDTGAFLDGLKTVVENPSNEWQDVYSPLAKVAKKIKGRRGTHEIFLVTLAGGDAENDLEGTVTTLRRANVRLGILCGEAILSDTWLLSHASSTRPPKDTELAIGGDAPFAELAWGWMLQGQDGHEASASGFANYGLTRLAAGTGGKVFLWSAPNSTHTCAIGYSTSCVVCANDHAPTDRHYLGGRLQALSPMAESRRTTFKRSAGDDYLRLQLEAWNRLSKAGIVRSKPSVKAGGSLKPQRRQQGSHAFALSLNFSRMASKAKQTRKELESLIDWLVDRIGKVDPDSGSPRYRAACDLTLALMRVTRMNYLLLEHWSTEIGPVLAKQDFDEVEPPETAWRQKDYDVVGVSHTSMCLCHGVEPFLHMRLGGGEELREELATLSRQLEAFWDKHANTPFAAALRRSGLSRFTLTYRGRATTPVNRERPTSEQPDAATTTNPRPGRPQGGGTGSTGPTTGG